MGSSSKDSYFGHWQKQGQSDWPWPCAALGVNMRSRPKAQRKPFPPWRKLFAELLQHSIHPKSIDHSWRIKGSSNSNSGVKQAGARALNEHQLPISIANNASAGNAKKPISTAFQGKSVSLTACLSSHSRALSFCDSSKSPNIFWSLQNSAKATSSCPDALGDASKQQAWPQMSIPNLPFWILYKTGKTDG